MRERGKTVDTVQNLSNNFNFCEPEISCMKHPNRSSTGICAYCLRDRLVKLVCSECGEQRLSSCSCSDISSSYRNSCSMMEVGSVGRISFLMENEKTDQSQLNYHLNSKKRLEKAEEVSILRRSSSSCVEVKKSRGFWRIKRLFGRKRNKGLDKNGEFCDEKSEIWLSDIVSRSRSLCSLRGGKRHSFLDEGSDFGLSSAKISDVTSGIFLDHDKKCDLFSDSESRKSGFKAVFGPENGLDSKRTKRNVVQNPSDPDRVDSMQTCCVFPVKESEFSAMDESAFIDLKLDLLPESKQESAAAETSDHGRGFANLASLKGNAAFDNGESCRITVNERGSRSHRVWKWIFKYHNSIEN